MRKRKGEGLTAATGMSFQTLAQSLPVAEAGLTIALLLAGWHHCMALIRSFALQFLLLQVQLSKKKKKNGFSETRV